MKLKFVSVVSFNIFQYQCQSEHSHSCIVRHATTATGNVERFVSESQIEANSITMNGLFSEDSNFAG